MDVIEKFKARMAGYGQVATGEYANPNPALQPDGPVVPLLIDVMHYCNTRGVDFDSEVYKATKFAEYEWEMMAPVIEFRRQQVRAERAAQS